DVARWDVLVSPNEFSTEVFRRAFRYEGRIIETGYPRNDVLSSPDAAGIGAAVRRRLGVPDGVRAVLYAPTWRDDAAFSLALDLAEYRDHVRGFYFDFEREAPGPLLATTAEVCAALDELDDVRHRYADAYAAFAQRFCALEDGRAAERVVDAVFTD